MASDERAGARRRLDGLLASPDLAGQVATATTPTSVSPVLPVDERLAGLLPAGGLRRGGAIRVANSTAVLLTLLARASTEGAWCAVLGMPQLGLLAAREAGISLERLLLVNVSADGWDRAAATLVDGVELLVVAPPVARVAPRVATKILRQAREAGSTVIVVGEVEWPRLDATLSAGRSEWHGIGRGHGRLLYRDLEIVATGTGALERPRSTTIRLGVTDKPSITNPMHQRSLRAVA